MNTTSIRGSIRRIGTSALLTAAAGLALAAPAQALEIPNPDGPGSYTSSVDSGGAAVADAGWELVQVATGALGGLALAGMGIATVAGVRRHQAHPA